MKGVKVLVLLVCWVLELNPPVKILHFHSEHSVYFTGEELRKSNCIEFHNSLSMSTRRSHPNNSRTSEIRSLSKRHLSVREFTPQIKRKTSLGQFLLFYHWIWQLNIRRSEQSKVSWDPFFYLTWCSWKIHSRERRRIIPVAPLINDMEKKIFGLDSIRGSYHCLEQSLFVAMLPMLNVQIVSTRIRNDIV